ncbi:putative sulphate transporter, SulP family [Cupriavidus taiwanensis]|uniref:SulP family inorganic anion transporter n=1 Tax=Cupriavidus taiwanensis TaxID=164546 RepID=UPI000E151DB8|nr:SulP family inorganic anion transporter [Cupriavidus taiwanensis]SOZ18484.1 putative sulphate transporter, SulP family [Cupriavidus taiwanensis]SOZ31565.1 putative sulphate transporter, SulP family [Cupriavidus taiwanensis]SOZ47516.1 putative sulphate transporter, SulP family [Cupriavidus taiwanensis]
MIALREAWLAGLFRRGNWLPNLVSGVIVGVVALPLAMAFAIASGAKPEQGLYTAIVAGLAVSLFGGSRLQIAGPTGAFIVVLAAVTARHGIDGLQIATLMAGLILLAMGLTRLGSVIRYIPAPVIVGFTAGIGVIIFVGQWRDFFGLPPVAGTHFHEKLWHLLQALPQWHPATTALALGSLALVVGAPRVRWLRRVPGPLVALVVATAVQALFRFDGVATIGTAFGGLPRGLPVLALPDITLARVLELAGPAFTIAMLGAIESLLSAVVADGMAGTRHDSNQELVGQGIANVLAPLCGGFAATGAIARTATNIRNGGNSPLAGVVHALTLVLVLLFLAPLAASVPLAALAAILFVVAYNMSEMRQFARMVRRAPRADVAILLITFTLTVLTDLVVAVNIGVILAMLQFLRRMSASVEVAPQPAEAVARELGVAGTGAAPMPPGVLVYVIDGPFFFGAVEACERALVQTHTEPRVLLVRLGRVPFMDMTGLQTLEAVIVTLQKRGVAVVLAEANARVRDKLARAGVLAALGEGNYADSLAQAAQRCAVLAEDEPGAGNAPR